MPKKLFYYDGIKSDLLWDEATDAWFYYSNDPRKGNKDYFRLIPTIFRGVSMIANDVSKMPFRILKGKREIDNSQEYKNILEFLPNPRRLFSLLSMSLDLSGSAYAIPNKNRAGYIKELRYIVPYTIAPKLDKISGELLALERTINGLEPKAYKPGDEMLYWWLPDPDIEIGPPKAYPLKAAQNAAGVLTNLDLFVSLYFERGAVRPIIVSVDGDPPEAERERMESWLNTLWSGIKNAFKLKVLNAGTVSVQQVGDGLDQLQNQELNAEKRKDVAQALGIPYALLFSEAANYATQSGDQIFYYQNTVEPRCEFIASIFQEQLFTKGSAYENYRLEFTPETLDLYQEDEAERANSLNTYVNAGFPLLMACDILGIELTAEQRAELEAAQEEKKQRSEDLQNRLAGANQDQEQEQSQDENEQTEQKEELAKWRRKSLRAFKAGKSPNVTFDSDILPVNVRGRVMGLLKGAKDQEQIEDIFDNALEDPTDITDLISALRDVTRVLADE